ncbi:hypothetical protein Tco_0746049 [Tanacetum coccineum]
MDDFLVTNNFIMVLREPVHTDENVKTIEFNRHEINFERLLPVNTSSIQWEVSSIPTVLSWSGSISSDSFLPFVLLWLVIIVAVVGVGVTVVVVIIVAVVVVVESSYVVKLSFVIT